MGINMDIRNEPEYAFLDLDDLDDTERNAIRAILRPHTPAESFKLPWDIGGKEYELNPDIPDGQSEDVANQWPQYAVPESMANYEPCGMTTQSMITTLPAHHYAGPRVILYGEMPAMGGPYASSGGGEPNYSFVPQLPWAQSSPMYSSGSELMSPAPSRENDRRGGGRGRGSSKRDSYNRSSNMNNDMQTRYVVQPQHQFGTMMPMCHSSGAMYPVPGQAHPAAGTPMFLSPQSGYPPQGPQMYRKSSHSSYHHPSSYPSESHMSNATKYVKGSQGQATYYSQESQKSNQKQHATRVLQRESCPSAPPFRQPSSNSNEIETAKRSQPKAAVVNSTVNSSNTEARNNSVHNNNAKHSENKTVTFSMNHSESEALEVNESLRAMGNDRSEIVLEKKEAVVIPAALVDNSAAMASDVVKEKIREKEVALPHAERAAPVASQLETHIPPKVKLAESVEQNEKVIPKNTQAEPFPAKITEPSAVALPVTTASSASAPSAPPASVISWANVLKKAGPPMDGMRSTPPITKLPVGRATSINLPPPPVETAPAPKTSGQDVARNEHTGSTANRNSTEATTKPPEVSAWAETKAPAESSQQNNLNDPTVIRMGELLLKYQMDKQTVSLLPRGLTNRSNYCYINSILQALLACPPFYNLLMALPHRRNATKNSSTPLIDNMMRFVREFNPLTEGARVPRKDKSQKRGEETTADVQCGAAFEPSYVYTMLKNTSCAGVFSVEGRQEDAEEFLSCLLNGISDEMLEVMKLVNTESNDSASDDGEPNNVNFNNEEEWKVMGPKNKGSITRCTEFGRTPLSDIFRGQLRSRVLRTGEDATDNVQPFFTLQLDIEKAESVEEALETLVGRDQVEGMTCSKTKQQIEAWKQVTLEELPVILILHLKWFDYKMDGCSKIFKRVGFPIDLKLDSKLLSPNVAKKLQKVPRQKQYKLFAVTYHDGKEASKGHYVTDAFHVGYGSWVRYDDSSVKGIYEIDVLNPSPPRVPYLLYYRRCDTIGNNQPNTPRTR